MVTIGGTSAIVAAKSGTASKNHPKIVQMSSASHHTGTSQESVGQIELDAKINQTWILNNELKTTQLSK